MTYDVEVVCAAARLIAEFGDVRSAERAAGARIQTACNAGERARWAAVRAVLTRNDVALVSGSGEW